MSFFDELKGKSNQLLNRVGEKMNETRDLMDLEFKKMGYRKSISTEEAEIKKAHERLGRRLMEIHRQSGVTDEAMAEICREVEDREKRVTELEDGILRLQEEHDQAKAAKARTDEPPSKEEPSPPGDGA